jgi:hypothetical protein
MTIPVQLDLLGAVPVANPINDPVHGLIVKVVDACKCGSHVLAIGPGKEPHKASLRCTDCNSFRGWLSLTTWTFLAELCRNGLRPSEPIEVRRGPSQPVGAAQ